MKTLTVLLAVLFSFNFAQAGELEDVKAWAYTTPYGAECDKDKEYWVANEPVEKYELKYQNEWSDEEETATFYAMMCWGGAYNFTYIVIERMEYDNSLRVLSFAEPVANYVMESKYSENLEMEVDVVKSWSLEGMSTTPFIGSPQFDLENNTITTFFKGRGIGDAFYSNVYTLNHGAWNLTKGIADPSFDGDITPITIFGK